MGPRRGTEMLLSFPRGKYEEFFQEADTDDDGFIAYNDLQEICKKYDYKGPEHQLLRCFNDANTNNDGNLSFVEYMIAMGLEVDQRAVSYQNYNATLNRRNKISVKLLEQIFSLFDKDGDGEIDKTELNEVFKELSHHKVSEADIQRIVKIADADGSGTLNFKEFIDILLKEGIAKSSEDTEVETQDEEPAEKGDGEE